MAKKKINKSEAIRRHMAEHPDASVKDVAKALKVQPGLVYQVKASLHDKKRRKKIAKGKPGAAVDTSVEKVIAALNLIKL